MPIKLSHGRPVVQSETCGGNIRYNLALLEGRQQLKQKAILPAVIKFCLNTESGVTNYRTTNCCSIRYNIALSNLRVNESRPATGMSLHLFPTISILVLSWAACATSRLFSARSRYTGEVFVLLDTQFTINVTAQQNGRVLEFRQVSENNVSGFNLFQHTKNRVTLELVFKGDDGQDSGFLKFRFARDRPGSPISFSRFFDLKPGSMFRNLTKTATKVEFQDPAYYPRNMGYDDMYFLCDIHETLVFQRREPSEPTKPTESDDHDYSVTMETTHLQAQAFGVKHGQFGPRVFKVCTTVTGVASTSSDSTAAVVGPVAAAVLIISLVAVAVVLIHWRPWKRYEAL